MLLRAKGLLILLLLFLGAYAQQGRKEFVRLLHKGQFYISEFKADSAIVKFDSALVLALKSKDNYDIGVTLSGLGNTQWYLERNLNAIDTFNLAIKYLSQAKGIEETEWELYSALRVLGNIYDETGDYEKAFIVTREALDRFGKTGDRENQMLLLIQMGSLYRSIGDYTTALSYYHQTEELKPIPKKYEYRELYLQMGRLYSERGIFDSAMSCFRKALPGHPYPKVVYLRIGEVYLLQKRPYEAAPYFLRVINELPYPKDSQVRVPAMLGMAKIFMLRNQSDSALNILLQAFDLTGIRNAKHNKRDVSLLLYDIYLARKDSARAFKFYHAYVMLKDSVISGQFKGQLYAFKQNAEETEHAAQVRLLRWSIVGLLALGGLVIFILLLRANNEKLKLNQRAGELEMQALRAQMNPHFIFNCLSAINHFILKNDTENASNYLTRFARLIRLVLINSGKPVITLEEELDMLKLYLNMEQLRFINAFDFQISYEERLQPAMITVPSFILQPFCENAIWHGLLHKDGKGELKIDFRIEKDILVCTINDNGIGRIRAAEIKTTVNEKTGSFGHKLTTERLALYNHTNVNDSFLIEDIKDADNNVAGTRVILHIKNRMKND